MDAISQHKTSYSLFFSLLLHVIALLAIGLYFDFSSKKTVLGEPDAQAIASYVYQEPQAVKSPTLANTSSTPKQTHIPPQKNAISLKKVVEKMHTTNTATSSPPSVPQNQPNQGQKTSELVALLHAAIQKQQRYPITAMQMEREGRVTLTFTLHTNGTVSRLSIAKSSGTISLDEAALAAVHSAAPFSQVDRYLQAPQEYRIDVVFELT